MTIAVRSPTRSATSRGDGPAQGSPRNQTSSHPQSARPSSTYRSVGKLSRSVTISVRPGGRRAPRTPACRSRRWSSRRPRPGRGPPERGRAEPVPDARAGARASPRPNARTRREPPLAAGRALQTGQRGPRQPAEGVAVEIDRTAASSTMNRSAKLAQRVSRRRARLRPRGRRRRESVPHFCHAFRGARPSINRPLRCSLRTNAPAPGGLSTSSGEGVTSCTSACRHGRVRSWLASSILRMRSADVLELDARGRASRAVGGDGGRVMSRRPRRTPPSRRPRTDVGADLVEAYEAAWRSGAAPPPGVRALHAAELDATAPRRPDQLNQMPDALGRDLVAAHAERGIAPRRRRWTPRCGPDPPPWSTGERYCLEVPQSGSARGARPARLGSSAASAMSARSRRVCRYYSAPRRFQILTKHLRGHGGWYIAHHEARPSWRRRRSQPHQPVHVEVYGAGPSFAANLGATNAPGTPA